jgi:hypothetical protein
VSAIPRTHLSQVETSGVELHSMKEPVKRCNISLLKSERTFPMSKELFATSDTYHAWSKDHHANFLRLSPQTQSPIDDDSIVKAR